MQSEEGGSEENQDFFNSSNHDKLISVELKTGIHLRGILVSLQGKPFVESEKILFSSFSDGVV